MASAAPNPGGAAVGVAVNGFLDLCRAHPNGLATLENVADSVLKSGITKEELRLQDFSRSLTS